MNRALFIDRDGILDELVFYPSSGEWEAPRRVEDLDLIPTAFEPLARLATAGWLLFVITNQPSYAKGKVSREELEQVQDAVLASLRDRGIAIARAYACFHHPEAIVDEMRVACECRKPGTLFLREAAREFDIDLGASWMVGDQDSDLLCGRAAGCRLALIEHRGSAHKRGEVAPDLRCRDLADLARFLVGEA